MLNIEVAYALPEKQTLFTLEVAPGSTAEQAVVESGMADLYPEIDLSKLQLGVFSQKVALDYPVQEGDRIEIYRPLQIDPKEARRRRVKPKSPKK